MLHAHDKIYGVTDEQHFIGDKCQCVGDVLGMSGGVWIMSGAIWRMSVGYLDNIFKYKFHIDGPNLNKYSNIHPFLFLPVPKNRQNQGNLLSPIAGFFFAARPQLI